MSSSPITFRGPPYIDGLNTDVPWVAGQGSNISGYQYDLNNWNLLQMIVALQNSQTAGIAYVNQPTPTTIYFHLTDHTVIGPINLPVASWNWRGAWAANASYAVMDVFSEGGAIYLCTWPDPGQPTFYAGANDGNGNNYFAELIAPASSGTGTINQTTVAISSHELLNLGSSPVEIVPAQGPGVIINVLSASYELVFGTTPYIGGSPEGGPGGLYYNSDSTYAADVGDEAIATATEDSVYISYGISAGAEAGAIVSTGALANQPVNYCNFNAAYVGGDGVIYVTVLWTTFQAFAHA